jgi:hypothetical protein
MPERVQLAVGIDPHRADAIGARDVHGRTALRGAAERRTQLDTAHLSADAAEIGAIEHVGHATLADRDDPVPDDRR